MAARTIYCLELRLKLQSYYKHDFQKVSGAIPLKNHASLAKALKINAGTLSNLLHGRNDGREDRLPEKHLNWLTEQLILVTSSRLNRDQAYDLWRNCSCSVFERQLREDHSSDILSILQKRLPTLSVKVGKVPPLRDLQIFEEPFIALPGEQILYVGQKVRFEVKTRVDQCLVIISSSPISWYWMSPSEQHEGPTFGGIEYVPKVDGYGIGDRGPHRIIAIELDCKTPPYFRERGTPIQLQDHMLKTLEEELLKGSTWRWGEAKFFVEKPELRS